MAWVGVCEGCFWASRGNPGPLAWPSWVKMGAVRWSMGGSKAVITPGSNLGLPCPSEGLGIQLGIYLTPWGELELGNLPAEGYIIGQAGRKVIFRLAGSYDVEVAHEVSRSHGLVGEEVVTINTITPDPVCKGGDGPLPGFPGNLQVLTITNL